MVLFGRVMVSSCMIDSRTVVSRCLIPSVFCLHCCILDIPTSKQASSQSITFVRSCLVIRSPSRTLYSRVADGHCIPLTQGNEHNTPQGILFISITCV